VREGDRECRRGGGERKRESVDQQDSETPKKQERAREIDRERANPVQCCSTHQKKSKKEQTL